MGVEDHRAKAPKSVEVAVLTVSDSRTDKDDFSGKAIEEIMRANGHKVLRRQIVKDDIEEIQKALRGLIEDEKVRAVIINGGTGICKRDVTLEALAYFEEKAIPGFGELFRALSFKEIGAAALLSRATAFVTEGKVVFSLPGSEKAVRLACSQLIGPELGHIVWEIQR